MSRVEFLCFDPEYLLAPEYVAKINREPLNPRRKLSNLRAK
jgi:hypothetical protein